LEIVGEDPTNHAADLLEAGETIVSGFEIEAETPRKRDNGKPNALRAE